MERDDYGNYIKDYFRSIAQNYDLIELVVNGFRKKLAAQIGHPPKKVLDAACGTGSNALILAEKGHKVTGVDISPDMLALAKRKASGKKITFLEADASAMKFWDAVFDVSVITFSLHDMPEKVALRALREMKRVTKKGGRIFIADYAEPKTLASRIAGRIVSNWETMYYSNFMKKGLDSYLKGAKLAPLKTSQHFFGSIILIECINKKEALVGEKTKEHLELKHELKKEILKAANDILTRINN